MAGVEAEVSVFGETLVKRQFVRFADNLVDSSDAFRAVAVILSRSTARNFATRGVSGGSPWRELAPSTRARKLRLGQDPRILRATGRLYASLVVDTPGPDHIQEIGPQQMRWGSRVPYGRFHQSSAPRTKIPYRPPVRLNPVDKREIVKTLQRSLVEG